MKPLVFLLLSSLVLSAADDKSALIEKMNGQAEYYGDISRKIWEFAELGYKENQSSAL